MQRDYFSDEYQFDNLSYGVKTATIIASFPINGEDIGKCSAHQQLKSSVPAGPKKCPPN